MWIPLLILVIILGSAGLIARAWRKQSIRDGNLADDFEIIEDK